MGRALTIVVVVMIPVIVAAEPPKRALGARLACAFAVADGLKGKAGGGETGQMTVACSPESGRRWTCLTSYPDEPDKTQTWDLVPEGACDLAAAKFSCFLQNKGGSLRIIALSIDGVGVMNLRLDLDVRSGIGAKVCGGPMRVMS